MRHVFRLLVIGLMGLSIARPASPSDAFEAVSIRRNTSGSAFMSIHPPAGESFVATSVSLGALIMIAYDVRLFQLAEVPAWSRTERYDISGKADSTLTWERLRPMLRTMLADRFELKAHTERKELAGYALVSAKSGPRLQTSAATECGVPKNTGSMPCGAFRLSAGRLEGDRVSIRDFIEMLANQSEVARPIEDLTGIEGVFDIRLEWTPGNAENTGSDSVSVFSALQEQLGLRLQPQKMKVEVIVVDHAEKASEN